MIKIIGDIVFIVIITLCFNIIMYNIGKQEGKQKAEEEKEKKSIDITKMCVCDFCYDEYRKYKIPKTEVRDSDYKIDLDHKKIRICAHHLKELRDGCDYILKQQENKTDDCGRVKIEIHN